MGKEYRSEEHSSCLEASEIMAERWICVQKAISECLGTQESWSLILAVICRGREVAEWVCQAEAWIKR